MAIDTGDGRLPQAISAIDPARAGALAIWTSHTVSGGAGSMVRWYEIDPVHVAVPDGYGVELLGRLLRRVGLPGPEGERWQRVLWVVDDSAGERVLVHNADLAGRPNQARDRRRHSPRCGWHVPGSPRGVRLRLAEQHLLLPVG